MTHDPTNSTNRLIDFYVEDATDRLRFQQEFTVAGFRTLILMNGGAVIALLTYAGNAPDKIVAANFIGAFAGYISGLVSATFAYLTAYAGQAHIMQHSSAEALALIAGNPVDEDDQDRHVRHGNRYIAAGIALCILSVGSFVIGSVLAMRGLLGG
jgi:hypothetical protein